MRRFLLLATAGALAALFATSPAAAKGPSTASLTGPGLDHALPVNGDGESGPGTPLGSLVQFGGYFPQMFLEVPDPTIRARPAGDLGARYRVVYRVPGPNETSTIVQDVYPYAKTPVTYMRSGQRFWDVNRTHGGWFVAGPGLKATLVAAGLPESPPSAASGGSFPWAWTLAGVLAVVVLLALVLRRRRSARLRMLRSTA
ncbi:MAG: hypothetical protein ACJ75L_09715 [Gaiellaceae bacterium]